MIVRAIWLGGLITAWMVTFPAFAETKVEVSFKKDVYPIIQHRCLECHEAGGKGTEKTGMKLVTYEDLMKGTIHGPVITPKDPLTSNLLRLIDGSTAIRMPHDKQRLTPCEIKTFRDWISQGAKNN